MRCRGNTIAFVPTMGFLHEGHLALVSEARRHAHLVVVSIYVNPGQFSPSEDFSVYPSDFEGDVRKLMAVPGGGVDVVFHPHNLYDYDIEKGPNTGASATLVHEHDAPPALSCVEQKGMGHETWVRVHNLEKGLCGKSRPIFFRGVATVVTKLFNIVDPDVAVFGKKDYQQWRLIQRMVTTLFTHFIAMWNKTYYVQPLCPCFMPFTYNVFSLQSKGCIDANLFFCLE